MDTFQIQDNSGDKKYFTIIPNYILNHSTDTAQALYMQLKRLAGEGGIAYPGHRYLMGKLKISQPTLRKELKYLLSKGWIKDSGVKTVQTEGGPQQVQSYEIVDLWHLNNEFYNKRGEKIDTPLDQRGEKIVSQRGEKIATKEEPNTLRRKSARTKVLATPLKVEMGINTTTDAVSQPTDGDELTFEQYCEEGYEEVEMYRGEAEGMVRAWKHKGRKTPYTEEEMQRRYRTHVGGQTSRREAYRALQGVSSVWLQWVKLCERELGKKPIADAKSRAIIKFAIGKVGKDEVLEVIEDWFHQGKPDEETIQITRALSGNHLNNYIARK